MADAPLLTYQIWTSPSPVQTGTAFRLTVGVAPPKGQTVYCNQIWVSIPLSPAPGGGLAAPDPNPQFGVNTSKWALAQVDVGPLPGDDDGTIYATGTFTCQGSADFDITYPLVFEVTGVGDATPGSLSAGVLTQEQSGTTSDPTAFTKKAGSWAQVKVPPQLFLGNFMAAAPTNPTVPATQFDNGAAIQLSWESNADWFQLYQANENTPIYAGSATSYQVASGPATDTTFVLQAIASGDPSGDTASGFAPIYFYDALTITVRNPNLTPNTLSVGGATTIGSTGSPSTLTVNGAESVTGNLTVGGAAQVTGAATVGSAAVQGNLTVGGTTTSTGALSAPSISASGAVSAGSVSTGASSLGSAQATSLAASGTVTAGSVNAGSTSLGSAQASSLNSAGRINVGNVGDDNAMQVINGSSQSFSAFFQNTSGSTNNYITGIGSQVVNSSDCGIATNGQYGAFSPGAPAFVLQLPTRAGNRVGTYAVCLQAEIYLSGSGRTTAGSATVDLGAEVSDMLLQTGGHAYRVLLTPSGPCNGLTVTERSGERFVVEELGNGTAEVDFDWLVVARIPKELGSTEPAELPDRLPDFGASVAPSNPPV